MSWTIFFKANSISLVPLLTDMSRVFLTWIAQDSVQVRTLENLFKLLINLWCLLASPVIIFCPKYQLTANSRLCVRSIERINLLSAKLLWSTVRLISVFSLRHSMHRGKYCFSTRSVGSLSMSIAKQFFLLETHNGKRLQGMEHVATDNNANVFGSSVSRWHFYDKAKLNTNSFKVTPRKARRDDTTC